MGIFDTVNYYYWVWKTKLIILFSNSKILQIEEEVEESDEDFLAEIPVSLAFKD